MYPLHTLCASHSVRPNPFPTYSTRMYFAQYNSPNTNPTAMSLSHLLTFTTFSHSSYFTNIPTPPVLSLFPHHHSLYLLPLTPKKRAPPLHLASCKQHISTSRFLSSLHTSVPLPDGFGSCNVGSIFPICSSPLFL